MASSKSGPVVLIATAVLFGGPLAAEQNYRTWKDYGGGPDSSKFVAFDQITKDNVGQLQVAWTYPTSDNNSYLFNPIVVDGVMYLLARNYSLVALDAATGKEIWVHENLRGIAPRGINYWESKDRKDRRLLFQMNHFLQAIDARTGKSILTFGKSGLVDLKEGLGRDPKTLTRAQSSTPGRIFENLLLLGSATGEGYFSSPGHVRAFDVITGKMAWIFHTIPQPGEFGYDTWPKDAYKYIGGVNTWGEITVDEARGIAYFPTGSPTYDYYGADRIGSNLFANCLLALDARTGKRLWHYQVVHHDLWDYDVVSAPQLVTVRHEGKLVDAVAQATKQGFLFVFDRVTGKPLWPIEERPVPKSDMPGEKSWPTQPFPTAPPPFSRQKMTVDDINPHLLTPEERAKWKDVIASARNEGLFTPPSTKESVALPGARGSSNWGTTASVPSKGIVYVLTQDWPSIYHLSTQQPGRSGPVPAGTPGQQGRNLYAQRCQACHGENFAGSPAISSLVGIASRMTFDDFRQVVLAGRGKMPAFSNLTTEQTRSIYDHIAGPGAARSAQAPAATQSLGGPVVASGGAPGGQVLPQFGRYGPMGGAPYPPDVETPADRYYTGYGFQARIISPPWSSLVAYDLNKGTIKWKVPLGEDPEAVAAGVRNTGVFGLKSGAVVTSTGLIFVALRDGKVRAYDDETGKVLWTADLPAGSEGIPAMYEVNGKQYLVVSASSDLSSSKPAAPTGPPVARQEGKPGQPRGYVAFALPDKPKTSSRRAP